MLAMLHGHLRLVLLCAKRLEKRSSSSLANTENGLLRCELCVHHLRFQRDEARHARALHHTVAAAVRLLGALLREHSTSDRATQKELACVQKRTLRRSRAGPRTECGVSYE